MEEQLIKDAWKKYYKSPFEYDGYNYVWSENRTMSLMLGTMVEEEAERIVDALNGKKPHSIGGLRHDGPDFFIGEQYIFCVRGWGFLTGGGGMNLPHEKAVKIQDSFIEFVFETLKEIEPIKTPLQQTLSIKELAPYLPYKVEYANTKNDKIYTLRTLSTEIDMVDFGWGDAMEVKEVKPLLRPLSQLTQEIEHNGERFVPIMRLFDIHTSLKWSKTEYYYVDYGVNEYWVGNKKNKKMAFGYNVINGFYSLTNQGSFEFVNYQVLLWQKLYQWHFDLFGLIEKGSAIEKTSK